MDGLHPFIYPALLTALFLAVGGLLFNRLTSLQRYFGIIWLPRTLVAGVITGLSGGFFMGVASVLARLLNPPAVPDLYGATFFPAVSDLIWIASVSVMFTVVLLVSGAGFWFTLNSEPGKGRYVAGTTIAGWLVGFMLIALIFPGFQPLTAVALGMASFLVYLIAAFVQSKRLQLRDFSGFRLAAMMSVLVSVLVYLEVVMNPVQTGLLQGSPAVMFRTWLQVLLPVLLVTGIGGYININLSKTVLTGIFTHSFQHQIEDRYLLGGLLLWALLLQGMSGYAGGLPETVEATADARSISGDLAVLLSLLFLGYALVVLGLSRSYIQPINAFRNALNRTSAGSLDALMDVSRKDDIGELAQTYNAMILRMQNLQEELAESERHAAWNQMARQVAHEIKNPLTPMKLSIQHLYQQVEYYQRPIEEVRPMVKRIAGTLIEEIDALSTIASDFSRFARPVMEEFRAVNVREFMNTVLELYALDNRIFLHFICDDDSMRIRAAHDELKRVFINLIKNAAEATGNGGVVYIRSYRHKSWAVIELADNGRGIDDGARDKIFVPNFSTKSSGTGLGLAISKKIIESHKGFIRFGSVSGVGTTFTVYLPLAE